MTVIIGNNYNQIADILSLVIIACASAYACREFYQQGYREGKESRKESEVRDADR